MKTIALALVLSFSSVALGQKTKTPKKTAPQNKQINAALQTFVDSSEISGAVALVGHKGKIAHIGAVGESNLDQGRAMKRSNLFAIASMTKPIVATGLMILQDEGKLSVDDKVSKYIPAFAEMKLKNGDAAEREITIRDCITHTSGLVGEQIFTGSLREAVDELATRKLGFQPGEKWQYSPGLNVAGRIIEIVSEQSLDKFLAVRIFEPLKMTSTTFFPNEKQQKRIATMYAPSEDKQSLVVTENRIAEPGKIVAPNPSGGLFSTARDMFRFYQMILNNGKFRKERIVSKEAVKQMTSPQTGELNTGFTPGNCWGLGWCITREPQGVTGMLSSGTFGHGGAFGTQGWVDPATKTIFVLMIQRTKLPNSDGSDIRKNFQQTATDSLSN